MKGPKKPKGPVPLICERYSNGKIKYHNNPINQARVLEKRILKEAMLLSKPIFTRGPETTITAFS